MNTHSVGSGTPPFPFSASYLTCVMVLTYLDPVYSLYGLLTEQSGLLFFCFDLVCSGLIFQKEDRCWPCPVMRNRDPHRKNVENISAICLPIVAMQHIRESPSASHAVGMIEWNDSNLDFVHLLFTTYPVREAIQYQTCGKEQVHKVKVAISN